MIAALWSRFALAFIPETAAQVQRRQIEIAFYAGATAALSCALGESNAISRNGLVQNIGRLQAECRAHAVEGKFQ